MQIPFMTLGLAEDRAAVEDAMRRVVDRGWFVLGPEVAAFEAEFADACGAAEAVGVNSGTDALTLALRGLDIGAGDEVITSPLTAAYTALAIRAAGARPVFADVSPLRYTIDPARVEAAVTSRTRAIMPVHLYGQGADMRALSAIAARHDLAIVEDCAQAHLATAQGAAVGTMGVAGAFSFYPTKNLGALGDAGAVVTNDRALAGRVRRLRNGGQDARYHHVESGVNSRLDELQAAVLRARLPFLAGWTARRRQLAARYRAALAPSHLDISPEVDDGHVYHLFVARTPARTEFLAHMASRGIGMLVHYPVPVHRQAAFADLPASECPVADRLCAEVVSLPLHPGLSDEDQQAIVEAVLAFPAADSRQ